MSYNPELFGLSIVIAIVAATAALWAALRLRRTGTTLGAALIMGVAVSGMHYTGMAAMRVSTAGSGDGMLMSGTGATAENFLLPLVIGISILAFILTATLALSPTDLEMRAEAELMQRIEQASAGQVGNYGAMPAPRMPHMPGQTVSRATQARRQADSGEPLSPH